MVKHTQIIRRQKPTNCLIVFDHFVEFALKGLYSLPKVIAHRQTHRQAHRQIPKKRCFEKYCSCDKACQFSALQGLP